jgi:hypothetical protein
MTARPERWVGMLLIGGMALSIGGTAQTTNAQDGSGGRPTALPQRAGSLPVVAAHQYRMAAKIRPLLLFWIGREQVGGAHAVHPLSWPRA